MREACTCVAVSIVASITLSGGIAHADAREVAERVAEQWRVAGARSSILPARFLFDDETVIVPLPPADEPSDARAKCAQIAIVGARGLSFRAKLSDAPIDPLAPEPAARASSMAGVLELRRCDRDRPAVRYVVITSEAGRGAVEVVIAHSSNALPTLVSIVPERTGGALPPPPEAGSLPPLPSQERRAESAEARARHEGAAIGGRSTSRAGEDGAGEEEIELEAGCHRIEVFGREMARERPGRRFRLDLDADLRDGDILLARDRTEAPDARLETCVGTTTRLLLTYAGSPPHSEVVITRGTWPLPARLPPLWGPVARSRMARVMFLRHVAVPADDPVYLAQGSTGTTPLPLPLETGGCYVAVVGLARGRARQLQLRALIGARESTDERGAAEEAALSAFCVRAHEPVRLEVFARGNGLAWGLAVFRVKSGVWELGR